MKKYLIIVFGLLVNIVYGQHLDIKEVTLSDQFLIESIEDLIERTENEDEHFSKGLGYIKLYESKVSCDSISRQYWITPSLTGVKPYTVPQFYTTVSDRPVLLYVESLNRLISIQFSRKSLKKLNKILSNYLLPAHKVKAKDEEGNVVIKDKNFRQEYYFVRKGIFINYDDQNNASMHQDLSY